MIRVLQMSLMLLLGFVTSGIAYDVAKGRILYRVVDEEGTPVAGAVFTGAGWIPDESVACGFGGTTDSNGMAQIDFLTATEISGEFAKTNYYRSDFHHEFGAHVGYPISDGRWQPYPLSKEIVLKRISKPVAMYVKKVSEQIPSTSQQISYDLMKGDWVTPFGGGVISDFKICVTGVFNKVETLRYGLQPKGDLSMTISFSNPGDGVYTSSVPTHRESYLGSVLVSDHSAPSAGYLPEYAYRSVTSPNRVDWINALPRPGQISYFRIRSETDKDGNIVSAFYGKIYGDLCAHYHIDGRVIIRFHYYLNPVPNDRNVEFDPEQNLMPHKGPKYMHPRFAP